MDSGLAPKRGAPRNDVLPKKTKTPASLPGFRIRIVPERLDQKSMPPMPPPGGIAGPAPPFLGSSATMASVVIRSAATEAAF
ncbi:hypothetical protein ABH999_007185 [Bradyrhizobium yuanmingense]